MVEIKLWAMTPVQKNDFFYLLFFIKYLSYFLQVVDLISILLLHFELAGYVVVYLYIV
jgi:hypothetical protein